MASTQTDLEKWFEDRPAWMREGARRLLQKGRLDDVEIGHLVLICKAEVGINGTGDRPTISIPHGAVRVFFQAGLGKTSLRLLSIFEMKGINALSPRKPLVFGGGSLSIVYGLNATGKSGYIRALKHASGQRKPGPLYADVFSADKPEQCCKLGCEINGVERELRWSFSEGPLDELRGLQVFDSDCGSIYINEENEAAFEPPELTLLTQLTEVCGRVNAALEAEILGKPSRKPAMPPALVTTQSAIWYGKLSHLTPKAEVEQRCQWSEELEGELLGLNQRLIEANPSRKARDVRNLQDRFLKLHRDLAEWRERLSDLGCIAYLDARQDTRAKRMAAETDAQVVFSNAPLVGVGSETWKLLWQQARTYSERLAYKGFAFPNTEADARCVLCHQPLNDDAKHRLISFEAFVKSGLATEAATANENLEKFFVNLGGIAIGDILNTRMDLLGLTTEEERNAVESFCRSLEERRTALLTVDEVSQLPPSPAEHVLDALKDRAGQLEAEAASLDQDASGQNRPMMEKRRDELVAMKWLFQQRASVQLETDRLRYVHRLRDAQHLTNTQQLSLKKSSLTERLITGAFVERFQSELDRLGAGRIKVKLLKTRAERGRVFHEIRLQDPEKAVRASDVLSEGEFRVVSLAAFLADVEIRGDRHPFIFDDPISSLDHVFEETTAERLVELSKARQVIVFTHRLSLLEYLENASKKAGNGTPAVISLRREHWGLGEPGEPSIHERSPQEGLDHLSKRLKEARSTLEQVGQAKYEEEAKGICGDLRILIERIIEKILLSGVITRHSREIHTKGKLKDLAKITSGDCTFFDDLMSKYSKYEHSQSEEAPVSLPQPDEIEADLKSVRDWIIHFKRRP